jgi:hypothetical protein
MAVVWMFSIVGGRLPQAMTRDYCFRITLGRLSPGFTE